MGNTSGRPRRIMIYSHYPKSCGMPFDVRNGPARLRESPWERAYLHHQGQGQREAPFRAPVYS